MKIRIGNTVVWFLLAVTFNLFVLAKIKTGMTISFTWLILSQLVSLMGLTLLSVSFILSGRFRFIEDWFGGLDKVYKIHHVTGGISFVLLLHHPLFLAINALPNLAGSWKYLWFSGNWPYNYGVISLYGILLLLVLTLLINLPYATWKKTHEYMGLALLFGCLHVLTITSDVSRYQPLRIWVIFLLAFSMWSVVYKRFLYGVFGPKYVYLIDEIRRSNDVIELWLKPATKKLNYFPGQFIFASFDQINDEAHPFSIASGSGDERIKLGIKILGDYTLRLKDLNLGDKVNIWGPYGRFFESAFGKKDMVWIAGGIGITPFLSLLSDETKKPTGRKIDLFYCVKSDNEAIFHNEIVDRISYNETFNYKQYCSNIHGRISAKTIYESVGNLENKKILLCGPIPMMESLANQFKKLGVKNKDIIFEDFNFK